MSTNRCLSTRCLQRSRRARRTAATSMRPSAAAATARASRRARARRPPARDRPRSRTPSPRAARASHRNRASRWCTGAFGELAALVRAAHAAGAPCRRHPVRLRRLLAAARRRRRAASASSRTARSTCAWTRRTANRVSALARAGPPLDEIRDVIATLGEERFARPHRRAPSCASARVRAADAHARSWPQLMRARGARRASPASIRRRAPSRRCACTSTTSSASCGAALDAGARAAGAGRPAGGDQLPFAGGRRGASDFMRAHSQRRSGAGAAAGCCRRGAPRLRLVGRKQRAGAARSGRQSARAQRAAARRRKRAVGAERGMSALPRAAGWIGLPLLWLRCSARPRRDLLQASRARAVRRARAAQRRPRRARGRVGPAAARAERLVDLCLRRARRQHARCSMRIPASREIEIVDADEARATQPTGAAEFLPAAARAAVRACWAPAARRWPARAVRAAAGAITASSRSQGDARFTRVVAISRASRHDHRPLRRAAGGQHAGRLGLGEPARAGRQHRAAAAAGAARSSCNRAGARAPRHPATSTASSCTWRAACSPPTRASVRAAGASPA